MADIGSMRNKALPLRKVIRTRPELTANIESNSHSDGAKDEGRKALAVRKLLDEIIFGATASDLVDGDLGGLDHVRRAIVMETIAERLQILEGSTRRRSRCRTVLRLQA